jgi:hypothetical protein
VLNALLSVINERVFHNDGAPVRCPLVSLFAASNELPEGKELEALFDRFLLRFDVGYLLVAANLRGVLVGPEPAIAATLTMDELRRAQGEVAAVKVTDDTVDALLAIRDACRSEGITASDRRWKKSLGIVRASTWLAGENKTCPRISRSWSTACGASPRSDRRSRTSSEPGRPGKHAERRAPRCRERDRDQGRGAQGRRPQALHRAGGAGGRAVRRRPRAAGYRSHQALESITMRIAIDVDERAFLHPKTREDIEREVAEAASIYWLARRDIEQVQTRSVARPSQSNLVEVLLSAPAVGDDADFERIRDLGRPGIEWDT